MHTNSTIIITGAAGFIGSCMTAYLNQQGFKNLILVDEFDKEEKELNLLHKKYLARIERENFFEWIAREELKAATVFHLGARTDTTEFDYSIHQKLNVEYSQKIWNYCAVNHIPLVYASSAATYGAGEWGYEDQHSLVEKLQPLNPYGISKNEFDKWALDQDGKNSPPFWAGLKFFNVYGPNEFHKGRMASVVFHSYNRIQQNGKAKLFRSHKKGINDGEQLRDFIYVKDVVQVCYWLMKQYFLQLLSSENAGLYNLGTGKARSFNDLVKAVFTALNKPPVIEYCDIPEDIREKYQYFTEANMSKLSSIGYTGAFCSLEAGVADYVQDYLSPGKFY